MIEKTLLDVERQLMAEDPEFARLFHDQLRHQPPTQGGSNGKIAATVAMLFSAILLLAGFAAGALTCVILTRVLCTMWWCSKGSDPKESHPERPDAGTRQPATKNQQSSTICGLLVVGALRRDGVDDLGLVARSAVHHAACPVLDVRR